MILGVDLDNTLISYDQAFRDLAVATGLYPPEARASKRAVREYLRAGPSGEEAWQRLQGQVYGPEIHRAHAFPGARETLAEIRARGIPVFVVSHKTRYGHFDASRTPLREAALGWLEQRGFLGEAPGLAPISVHFEGSRAEKAARIGSLGCTHFVDDLIETFAEPGFPVGVARLLFDPSGSDLGRPDLVTLPSWEALGDLFRGERERGPTGCA